MTRGDKGNNSRAGQVWLTCTRMHDEFELASTNMVGCKASRNIQHICKSPGRARICNFSDSGVQGKFPKITPYPF